MRKLAIGLMAQTYRDAVGYWFWTAGYRKLLPRRPSRRNYRVFWCQDGCNGFGHIKKLF
jgi:hypothetical protein